MAVRLWRISVASIWFGLVAGLAFIETPLKFLAPGMTLPVALGLGRLVLTVLDVLSLVLVVVLVVLGTRRPRVDRPERALLGGLVVAVAVQAFVVRPQLNARTDVILAGGDPGASPLHSVYVGLEVVVLVLLVATVVVGGRRAVSLTRSAESAHASMGTAGDRPPGPTPPSRAKRDRPSSEPSPGS